MFGTGRGIEAHGRASGKSSAPAHSFGDLGLVIVAVGPMFS